MSQNPIEAKVSKSIRKSSFVNQSISEERDPVYKFEKIDELLTFLCENMSEI